MLDDSENRGNKLLDQLEKVGFRLSDKQREQIKKKIHEIQNYVPTVGVLGQTGVGKSSLCNALFGQDVAEISDIAGCTREVNQYLLSMSEDSAGGLILADVPGLGESIERDEEYIKLYKRLLPQLDLVLWVLDGSARAYAIDEKFYNDHFRELGEDCPMIFVLNQVDLIQPVRSWDEKNNCPSNKQLENIHNKVNAVANAFSVDSKRIFPVSAYEKFGLVGLVDLIVEVLPNEKKFSFVREAKEENVSKKSKRKAEKGFWTSLWESVGDAASKAKEFYEENKEAVHTVTAALWTWWSKRK